MVKPLTDDDVFKILGAHDGRPSHDDVVQLVESHQALRRELDRVYRMIDVAVLALGKLRKEAP